MELSNFDFSTKKNSLEWNEKDQSDMVKLETLSKLYVNESNKAARNS